MHLPLTASQPSTAPRGDLPGVHSRTPSLGQRAAALRRIATSAARAASAAVALGLLLATLAAPAMAAPNRAYAKNGVSFQYPASWKITEDATEKDGSGMRSVDLEGPDDEIISLIFNPMMSAMDLDKFAATITQGREESARSTANAAPAEQATVGPTTSTPITRRVGGKEIRGLLQNFAVTMDGETSLGEARIFSLDYGDAQSVMIMSHARGASAKRVEAALGLVLDTLRYRVKR